MAFRNGDLRRVPSYNTEIAKIEQRFNELMSSVRCGAAGAARLECEELIIAAGGFIAELKRQEENTAAVIKKLIRPIPSSNLRVVD